MLLKSFDVNFKSQEFVRCKFVQLTLWSDAEWWHSSVGAGWGYEAAGNYGGHSGGGTCCGAWESRLDTLQGVVPIVFLHVF